MKNVLPIFEFYISSMYHLLRGISDYAGEHDWHLGIISPRFELPRHWSGDGILTHLTDSPQLMEFLRAHADIPVVSFNPPGNELCDFRYGMVYEDNEEIGRIAARYFLTLGDVHCCYYGDHPARRAAFAAELARNNRQMQTIVSPQNMHNLPWNEISHHLVAQLKKIKLPGAVFCENDSWARELLEAALEGGFRIPEDIAILGVDNETLICTSSSIHISSIDGRTRKVGYEGAAMLDRLMKGEPFPATPVLVPPVPLPIVRKSSDLLATGNSIIKQAVEFVRKKHTNNITVIDIAKAVCISDSGLRKLMNRKIGTSPCQLLQNTRLATACRLLRDTEIKIESVAVQSGFCDVQRLHKIFRDVLKTTPLRFRQESKE